MKHAARSFPMILATALLAVFSCGFLEFVFDEAHQGNDAFARGQYDQAAKQYTEAQIDNPTELTLDYNLGTALYKQGKHEDSMTAFRKVYKDDDPNVVADAHYNTGNALFMQKKLDEAVVEYTEALKIRPDDEDAKFNLELARRLLQQHEDEEKKKQDQKDGEQCDNPKEEKDQGEPEEQDQEGQPKEKPQEDKKEGEEEKKPDAAEKDEKKEDQPEAQPAAAEEKDMKELTPEQAARILDSLKKDELDEIAKQLLPKSGYGQTDKDW
jgi:Ca-activated chloride channel homolog